MSKSAVKLEADYWRARAQQLGELAKKTLDPQARADVLRIAADYNSIAVRAEAMARSDRLKNDT